MHAHDEDRTNVIRVGDHWVTSATERGEGPRGPGPGGAHPHWAGDHSPTAAATRTNTHDAFARGGLHPGGDGTRAQSALRKTSPRGGKGKGTKKSVKWADRSPPQEENRRQSVDTDRITGHHHSLHREDVDADGYRHNILRRADGTAPTRAFHYHRKGSIEAVKQYERTHREQTSVAAKTGFAAAWDVGAAHSTDKAKLSYYERMRQDHGAGRKGSTAVGGSWMNALEEMDAERDGRAPAPAVDRRGTMRTRERALVSEKLAQFQMGGR